jgi:hypothetical protein
VSSDRKYQVFVSSTYSDLPEARQELMLSLLSLGLIPTGMELYPTEENGQWPVIQKVINECDYYVVLLGGRYGTLSPIGLSYTHREFVYAMTKKKPVIAFIHDHPEMLPAERRETSSEGHVKFRDFRQLLQDKTSFRFWNNPSDLGTVARKAFPPFLRENPAPGWIRARHVTDLTAMRDVQEMRKRIEELEREREELVAGFRPSQQSLARGNDRITLAYSCNAYVKGDCKAAGAETSMTWDQVFACVAPQMLEAVSESVMRQALEESIATNALSDVQRQIPKAHAVRNVVLSTGSFNQIKIQLRAQGLIRKSSRSGEAGTFWQLTPLGDQTMTHIMAVPRKR